MPSENRKAAHMGKSAPHPTVHKIATTYLNADPGKRIYMIREGIDASYVDTMCTWMGTPKKSLLAMIGLSRATIDRKISAGARLSQNESESFLGIAKLIAMADQIVRESGDPEGFNAAVWVAEWLSTPHPALGGLPPGKFMDTAEGRTLVGNLLLRQQSAAFS